MVDYDKEEGKKVKKRRSYGAQSVHERKEKRRRRIILSKKSDNNQASTTKKSPKTNDDVHDSDDSSSSNQHDSKLKRIMISRRSSHKSINIKKKSGSTSSINLYQQSPLLSTQVFNYDDKNHNDCNRDERQSRTNISNTSRRLKNTKSVLETSSSSTSTGTQQDNDSLEEPRLQQRSKKLQQFKRKIIDDTSTSSSGSNGNDSENEFTSNDHDNDQNKQHTGTAIPPKKKDPQRVIYKDPQNNNVLTFDSIKMYNQHRPKKKNIASNIHFELSNDLIENTTPSQSSSQYDTIIEDSSGDGCDDDDPSYCLTQHPTQEEQLLRKRIVTRNTYSNRKKEENDCDLRNDGNHNYTSLNLTQKFDEETKTISKIQNRQDDNVNNQTSNDEPQDIDPIVETRKNKDGGTTTVDNSPDDLSELKQLCKSFKTVSTTTMQKRMNSCSSKNGLRKLSSISKLIREKLKELNCDICSYNNDQCGSDIEEMIRLMFLLTIRLYSKYSTIFFTEGILFVSCLLRYQLNSHMFEDMYVFYNRECNYTKWLLNMIVDDEKIMNQLVKMIGDTVTHHQSMNIKETTTTITLDEEAFAKDVGSILAPFLFCLHMISTETIANRLILSSQEDNGDPTWESLSKLVSILPQFNSYTEMEACLALIHRLRCTLLSSIGFEHQKRENKEQDCILATISRLHNCLPTAALDGIDRVGPMIPSDIHRKLYPANRPRAQLSFADWSRGVISSLQHAGVCENVASFSCNGVYTPNLDDMGTQIAKIQYIDVNKKSLSLFCLSDPTSLSEDCQFPKGQTIRINFSDFEDGICFGFLNHKDCAITISLTSAQKTSSGLHKVLSVQSSSRMSPGLTKDCQDPDSNLTMKVFIKRIEYEDFVRALGSRGLLLENEGGDDDHSSSVSMTSKFSSRSTYVHDHIEFTTHVDDSQQLRAMTRELKALHHQGKHFQGDIQYYDENERSSEYHSRDGKVAGDVVEKLQSYPLNASPKYLSAAASDRVVDSPQSHRSYHPQLRLTPVEVTPLGRAKKVSDKPSILPMSKTFNGNNNALERFTSICCCFGMEETMKLNMEDSKNIDIANAISLYEEAMENALNSARDLQWISQKLYAIPGLNQDTVNSFESNFHYYEHLRGSSEMWSSIRQGVEEEIFEKLHSTR